MLRGIITGERAADVPYSNVGSNSRTLLTAFLAFCHHVRDSGVDRRPQAEEMCRKACLIYTRAVLE
jgi:hypothetical protein